MEIKIHIIKLYLPHKLKWMIQLLYPGPIHYTQPTIQRR